MARRLLLLIALFTSGSLLVVAGQDIVRQTFCWNQDFRLSCSWKSILAIHEAYFTNDLKEIKGSSCSMANDTHHDPSCTEDIRPSVNKRCSGMSHCHFNLTEDHRPRQCYCEGVIILRYACLPETLVMRSCNTKATGSSGYIASPGYPRFYPKVQKCSWNVEESSNQKMVLALLDIDTRPPIRGKSVENCPDSLTIFEDSHKLRYICGSYSSEVGRPLETSGKNARVDFSSLEFMPSRGFLLYYKVHGCPTLPPPKQGYMVHRNETAALYMCCKDHVFENTSSNMVLLECVNNMRWNASLPACVSVEYHGSVPFELNDSKRQGEVKLDIVEVYVDQNKYIEEILIPTACVVGLVFGHIAAVILALKLKKKRKSSTAHEESSLPHTVGAHPSSSAPVASPAHTVAPTVLITDL